MLSVALKTKSVLVEGLNRWFSCLIKFMLNPDQLFLFSHLLFRLENGYKIHDILVLLKEIYHGHHITSQGVST